MTSFPKYERYKDSGVEWLGDVPEQWESERVFSAFNERVETGHPDLPNLNITIGRGVQVEEFEGARKKRLIEDLNAYKRAAKGDIAYNTMRMWQGAVGDVPVDGLVSPAYVVARPIKPINSRFYSYLFRTETFQTETNRHSYGIVSDRNRLYWLGFKNIVIPIPSREEQDRIVAFLDQKTAEIDALIAKKQRQIELLDEQKAILINRAVTRGLNPNAKLKPSGIEWIGEIPEHWEVKSLKHVSTMIGTGRTPSSVAQAEDLPDGVHWYTPGDYKKSGFLDTSDRRAKSTRSETVETFPAGSLFYIGIGATLGRVNLSLHEAGCNQQINVIVINSSAHSAEYMLHLLNSGREFIFSSSDFTTLPILNRSKTAALSVVAPPKDEQEAIAVFCADLILKIQAVQAKIVEHIHSLKTLRSTLIAHAVTGSIQVK